MSKKGAYYLICIRTLKCQTLVNTCYLIPEKGILASWLEMECRQVNKMRERWIDGSSFRGWIVRMNGRL